MNVVLPASLTGVAIVRKYQHQTRNGVAYAADLTRDGVLLGTIENDGNGGGTWFYNADLPARELWLTACTEFVDAATAMFARDAAEMGLPPLPSDKSLDLSLVGEYLADVLFDLTD